MSEIILATLNAKYAHSAFGLRYLLANMGELRSRAAIREFTVTQRPLDIAEDILSTDPKIVALGVYIWNVQQTTELVSLLKAVRADITIILGGPEVSYEVEKQDIVQCADYVITGEGEISFPELCQAIFAGLPSPKIIVGKQPDLATLVLPYAGYSDVDLKHRVLYVEASRGCPFRCQFCLSSLDQAVRRVPLGAFLEALDSLLARGARQFKFIDRTFNLQLATSQAILQFFLERLRPGLFLHFELVPDRLPAELRDTIERFPPGVLQFEIGVQTLNRDVELRIARRQNHSKLRENLTFLRGSTGVHIHADLIAGLPGETLESFAQGFNELVALGPQEIQVGILKRLRGTPIIRHTEQFSMVYNERAPYDILQNSTLNFTTIQNLKRFARYWDVVVNSGQFRSTGPMIWAHSTPFSGFWQFSLWLHEKVGQTHGIALDRMAQFIFTFLIDVLNLRHDIVRERLLNDYHRGKKRRTPGFLVESEQVPRAQDKFMSAPLLPRRQALHLA